MVYLWIMFTWAMSVRFFFSARAFLCLHVTCACICSSTEYKSTQSYVCLCVNMCFAIFGRFARVGMCHKVCVCVCGRARVCLSVCICAREKESR